MSTKLVNISVLLLSLLMFSACGDDKKKSAVSKTDGFFKDASVSGLAYTSGSISGLTGPDGNYTCEDGNNITFSVGQVTVGSTKCNSLITPIDLVTDGEITTNKVKNIVKFFTLLDSDNDTSNGMEITADVRELAENWTAVDFNSSSFETDNSTLKTELENNTSMIHNFPTDTEAENHLKATLMCQYAGAFQGSYSGSGLSGILGGTINPSDGKLTIIGITTAAPNMPSVVYRGTGAQSFVLDENREVNGTATGAYGPLSFNGSISDVDKITGSWIANSIYTGSFSLARVGSSTNAKHRVVGNFTGTDGGLAVNGLYSLDINSDNTVTGILYALGTDKPSNISGNYNPNTKVFTGTTSVSITVSGTPMTVVVTATGTYNTATGTLSSTTWSSTTGGSGTISGSGCILN